METKMLFLEIETSLKEAAMSSLEATTLFWETATAFKEM